MTTKNFLLSAKQCFRLLSEFLSINLTVGEYLDIKKEYGFRLLSEFLSINSLELRKIKKIKSFRLLSEFLSINIQESLC